MELLPPVILRSLSEKIYEKRKYAAIEIEKLVKEWAVQEEQSKIEALIALLANEYVNSSFAISRNGGLLALAAVAVGLGEKCSKYLSFLFPPVLSCFADQDSRVRYYACESAYNITKSCRSSSASAFFTEIFDALCKLIADSEATVKSAAELLDRLLKDSVSECPTFDLGKYMEIVHVRMGSRNEGVKAFIIGWLLFLNGMPEVDIVPHLNTFMEGVFEFFGTANVDLQVMTKMLLANLLDHVKNHDQSSQQINIVKTAQIIKRFLGSEDEESKAYAFLWMNELIQLAKVEILPMLPDLVANLLPALSSSSSEVINKNAQFLNTSLLALVQSPSAAVDVSSAFAIIAKYALNENEMTRLAALDWMMLLHRTYYPDSIKHLEAQAFPILISSLSDISASEEVIKRDLKLLSQISLLTSDDACTKKFLAQILDLLASGQHTFANGQVSDSSLLLCQYANGISGCDLLDARGTLIIKELIICLSEERVYRTFAELFSTMIFSSSSISPASSMQFVQKMIQTLNYILIAADETAGLRKMLRTDEAGSRLLLFGNLFKAWSVDVVCCLSLCLLSEYYELALGIIHGFAKIELTTAMLLQLDKLIQQLECPTFTFLRLHLIQINSDSPENRLRANTLLQVLTGLLTILPQSHAYSILKSRLDTLMPLYTFNQMASVASLTPIVKTEREKEMEVLMNHFKSVQLTGSSSSTNITEPKSTPKAVAKAMPTVSIVKSANVSHKNSLTKKFNLSTSRSKNNSKSK